MQIRGDPSVSEGVTRGSAALVPFQGDLVAAGVLSGNRNFEGRVHPNTRANYLASPPLVIAYALAGTVRIDFEREPLGEHTPSQICVGALSACVRPSSV